MSDATAHDEFAYRGLADSDTPSGRARRATSRPDAQTSFVGVTPPSTPAAVQPDVADESIALETAAVQVQFATSSSAVPPPLAKPLHTASSDDWAADEQSRQDVRSQQFSSAAIAARRESVRTSKVPSAAAGVGVSAASQHLIDMHDEDHAIVPASPHAVPQLSKQPSINLHGKDLRQFMSIASIEPISRHSNSVDWSDTMANPDETDHLSLMDPYYDLTRSKLTRLFSLFQPDENGMVSYSGFRRGMEAMGIVCADDAEFETFIDKVDEDHSGGISYDEFQHAIQEIKLAQLFSESFVHEMGLDPALGQQLSTLGSIEYSPDRIRSVYPIQYVEKFIYSRKPAWAAVRWISVEGNDALTIRRLSVRYCLHPLAVEDALDIDRERPKYEKYEEHSSLILQTVHAVDLAKLKTYQRMYRASMYTKDDMPSQIDRMDRKELEERLKELQLGCVMTNPEQLSVYMLKDVLISVQESSSTLWAVVKARLDTSYSRIRQHGTPFLVYTIVDACVDELTPIAHTFGAKLVMLDRLLHLDPRSFNVSRLQNTAKQLKGLKRLCKPLHEAIVQLAESTDFVGETLRYFRDVQDHIAIVEEDCEKHLDTCKSLVEEFHSMRAAQQSDVSYILALVAAIFLPAQFLTGLYGMNFENMPELRDQNGYYYWWIVVVSIAVLTIIFFRFYKKWL